MNVTRLREEFATLQTESNQFMDASTADGAEAPSPEQLDANEKRLERMQTIQKQIDQHTQFAKLKLANPADTTVPGSVQTPAEPSGREEFMNIIVADETPEQAVRRYAQHKAAINNFIRTGDTRGLQFANSALTTSVGSGALLPRRVGTPVVIKRMGNPIRQVIESRGLKVMETTTSEEIPVPVIDDTANSADAIAQNATGDNEKEPSITNLTLGNTLYDSGTVWSSNTLLNSLSFDLLAYLEPMLNKRIDRTQSKAWVDDMEANATVGKTTAGTATVTYLELLAWQHSIAVDNRANGAFIVSDGLFQTLRGLMDSQNHPIYQQSLRDDAPDQLLGWPIFVSADLAAPGAGAVSGLAVVADLLFVRDVTNRRIARYVNIPTYRDQFGIAEFANGDFKYAASGVRALKHAAA